MQLYESALGSASSSTQAPHDSERLGLSEVKGELAAHQAQSDAGGSSKGSVDLQVFRRQHRTQSGQVHDLQGH